MSSRRRTYLNLKRSILELFRTPAHWLKEFAGKWSIFDKPYLDQDYRGMHLDWPGPDWPLTPPWVGQWPPSDTKWRKHTVIYDEGVCSLSAFTGDCGELITVNGSISLLPPGTLDKIFSWVAVSSEPENASIVGISPSLGGRSVDISVQLADDWTGTATICAKASLVSGTLLKEFAVLVPSHLNGVRVTEGWIPPWDYALKNLPKIYEIDIASYVWDCGCVDIEVACCGEIGWDSGASAETIAREASGTVVITDSTGQSGPYDWSVSGTGFTLDNAQTVGLSNTLNADDTACGTADITVTASNGCAPVKGYVRCTTGTWTYKGQVGALAVTKCEATIENSKYEDQWCSMCPVDYGKCGELCGDGEAVHTSVGCGSHPSCTGEEEWCYVVGYKWWEWECA